MTDTELTHATTNLAPRGVEPTADQLPDELAALANASHRVALEHATAGVEHALSGGRALAIAKQQLAHGEWSAWLATNFEGSARTARRWMQAAEAAEDGRVAGLQPATVRALLTGVSENDDDAEQRCNGQLAARDPVERLLAAAYDAAVDFYGDGDDQYAMRLGEAVVAEARCNWTEEWPSIHSVLRRIMETEQRAGGGP
ncbi:MAG: DUF3102 domain-containing protein [Solirubrobacteraceae bacterium]